MTGDRSLVRVRMRDGHLDHIRVASNTRGAALCGRQVWPDEWLPGTGDLPLCVACRNKIRT